MLSIWKEETVLVNGLFRSMEALEEIFRTEFCGIQARGMLMAPSTMTVLPV